MFSGAVCTSAVAVGRDGADDVRAGAGGADEMRAGAGGTDEMRGAGGADEMRAGGGGTDEMRGDGGIGTAMPIKVRERSELWRTGSRAGSGAEDGGRGVGRPINVCERRALASRAAGGAEAGAIITVGCGGATDASAAAATGAVLNGAAVAGVGAGAGGAAVAVASSSSAPQSVSMSSVEGGVEGSVRGGSLVLAATRGGMDDGRPRALKRSASSLLTIVLGSHTPQMPSSDGSFS